MLIGRFFMIIPVLAIAGSLAAKKTLPASAGTFPTHGGLFVGLLVGVILIVGGLTFFPALALGPIVEHLAMLPGRAFLAVAGRPPRSTASSLRCDAKLRKRLAPPAGRPQDPRARASARRSASSIRGS